MLNCTELQNVVNNIPSNINSRNTAFKMLDDNFLTVNIVKGVYEGVPVPKVEDETLPGFKEYTDYKSEVSKFKAPIGQGWNKLGSKKSSPIPDDADKLGIITGYVETHGKKSVIVLDVDNIDKFKKFCDMTNIPFNMDTFTVQTGNGYHLYFTCPPDTIYRCRRYKDWGFDIKATGGYVIAPGSIHPGTHTIYTIVGANNIAPAPDWLLRLSNDKTKNEYKLTLENKIIAFKQNISAMSAEDSVAVADMKIDMQKLSSLPDNIKSLIKKTNSDDRSRDSMTVMNYLVSHEWTKEEILSK